MPVEGFQALLLKLFIGLPWSPVHKPIVFAARYVYYDTAPIARFVVFLERKLRAIYNQAC
jgi:hypothetical protein